MRGDTHLGRRKAGEKSSLSRAGSDWHELEEADDDPYQRTPALPKAGHPRRMARNPSMTAAKTAVPSMSTNRNDGSASVAAGDDRSNRPPSRYLGGPTTTALAAPALESILIHIYPRVLPKVQRRNK